LDFLCDFSPKLHEYRVCSSTKLVCARFIFNLSRLQILKHLKTRRRRPRAPSQPLTIEMMKA